MLNALNAEASLPAPPSSSGSLMNCHFLNASASSAESPVAGYVITSAWFIGYVLMFACVPSGRITGTFSRDA